MQNFNSCLAISVQDNGKIDLGFYDFDDKLNIEKNVDIHIDS